MNKIPNYTPISNQPSSTLTDSVIQYKDKGNSPPSPSLEKIILRTVAAILTLGTSEMILLGHDLLKGIMGAVITSSHFGKLSHKERTENLKDFEEQKHTNTTAKLQVTTADGAILDGRIIDPKTTSSEEKKYVIWLNGLGQAYESRLNHAVQYSDSSEASILLFNYRGAGDSKGLSNSGQDYVTDTLAMVSYLKSIGVKEENITIHGYSMGGGIGSNAAARLEKVKFINDRSFTSLSAAAKEVVARETRHKIGDSAAKILGAFVGFLIKNLDFDLNTKKIYTKSEANHINSLESRTLFVFHPEDNFIRKSSITSHHSILPKKDTSLSGHIVNLSERTLHDNQAKLIEIANKLGKGNVVQYEKFMNYWKENGKPELATDAFYRNYLRNIVQDKLKTNKKSKNLNKISEELKALTFSGEKIHGRFILDFPEADKILDFVGTDQRFAKATSNNPKVDFGDLTEVDINL